MDHFPSDEFFYFISNIISIQPLIGDLLTEAAAPLFGGTETGIFCPISSLEKPGAKSNPQPGFDILRFDHQNKGAFPEFFKNLFIDYVQRRLVDQADVNAVFSQPLDGVETPVEHFTVGNDVAVFPLSNR